MLTNFLEYFFMNTIYSNTNYGQNRILIFSYKDFRIKRTLLIFGKVEKEKDILFKLQLHDLLVFTKLPNPTILLLHTHARRRIYDVCDGESRNDSPTLSFQLSVEVGERGSVTLFRCIQANLLYRG